MFTPVDFGRKRRFSCSACTTFIISTSSEEDVLKLKPREREAISKEAQECDDVTVLLIYTERTSTQGKLPIQLNTVTRVREPRRNWL